MNTTLSDDPIIKWMDTEITSLPQMDSQKRRGRPANKFEQTQLHANVSVDVKSMLVEIVGKLCFVTKLNQILSYAIILLGLEIRQLSDEELSTLSSFSDLTKLIEENRMRRIKMDG
jgi:hypothetical protein